MTNGLFVTKIVNIPQPEETNYDWFIAVSFSFFGVIFIALVYLIYVHLKGGSGYRSLGE